MKFGWFSDTHLDTLQYGMERRRKDFEIAFGSALDEMHERGIRVVIHSGDIINSNRPSPQTMKFLQAVSDKMTEDHMVMLVVSGNHDRTTPHWIETLHNSDPQYGIQLLDFRLMKYPDEDKNGFTVSFYGVPAMSAEQFRKHEFKDADVLVTHQMIKEFIHYEQTDIISLEDIPPKYKLVAVGDVHEHKIIEQPGRPGCFVGYPGSTELKSESEDGNKYWVECTIDINKRITLLPSVILTRPVLRVDLTQPGVSAEQIDQRIGEIVSWEDNHPHTREPILFITYLNTLQDVMPKFKAAFNPDKYILRFRPVFTGAPARNGDGKVVDEKDSLTVEEILRGELSTYPELFGIASQLIKPDVDEIAALDEFISGRIREIEAAATA